MRYLILGLCVLGCSGAATAQEGGIEHTVEYATYDVSAGSLSKLGKAVKKAALQTKQGGTNVVNTESKWTMKASTHETPESCGAKDVSFALTSIVTVPDWLDVDKVSRDEKYAWEKYSEALKVHALGHLDIDYQMVEAVRDGVLSVPPADNCDTLKQNIATATAEAEKGFDKAHKAYDKRTKDGRLQGAVLKKQL